MIRRALVGSTARRPLHSFRIVQGQMAKKKKQQAPEETAVSSGPEAGELLVRWLTEKRKSLYGVLGTVAVVGGAVWFMHAARIRRETFAETALDQARAAVESGNVALAANNLDRIVNENGGTKAGQEALLLLAKVRILQGNAEVAITELRTFLGGNHDTEFEPPAANLLGNALEQLGRFGEAATAYEQAADASPHQLIRAQYLMDAGRVAALAGDVERSLAAYQRVLDENEDEPVAQEARLRMAEVRPPGTGA